MSAGIVAIRLRREREIVEALRAQGALSPASATAALEPHGLAGRAVLRTLLRNGSLVETAKGAFYLDEVQYAGVRATRRIRIIAIVGLALAVGLALLLAPMLRS